jgi:hypothetical protein
VKSKWYERRHRPASAEKHPVIRPTSTSGRTTGVGSGRAGRRAGLRRLAAGDDVVDEAVGAGLGGAEDLVAFGVAADLRLGAAGVPGEQGLLQGADAEDLASLDLQVAGLALPLRRRLVDQNPAVGQREPLAMQIVEMSGRTNCIVS